MNLFKKVKGVVPFSALLAASIFGAVFFLCTNFWLHTVYAGGTEGYTEPAESYINPLWSYDGNYLLLSDKNSDGVYIYNIDDSSLLQITDAPSSGYKYNWTYDSKKVAFKLLIKANDGPATQMPVIFDLDNNEIVSLHHAVNKAGVPSFSKDGQIAFTIGKELIILNKDGNVKSRIYLGYYANLTPLSPDGTKVVYNDGNDQMWLIDSNGSNRKKLTSNEHGYFNPIWSPDSSKIGISTLSGELKVIDIATGNVFYLDKGNNPSWSPDSKYVLYSKVESVAGYKITSADIYLIKYDGSQKIPLTTTKEELEGYANWSPDGGKIVFGSYISGDLFWVPLRTPANTIKALEGVSLPQLDTVEKIQYDSLKKWEGKIPSIQKKTKNNLPEYLALSTSSISNVPYIHQVYDTPNEFNGYWACNASSALMAITYYGILPYWDCAVSIPYPHTSHYGRYVSDIYSYNGHTYNIGSPDASGNIAYGGYGYIVRNDWADTKSYMRDYLENHGLTSSVDWSPTWSELQNEIDISYPLVLLTSLTTAGHYVLSIGYTSEQHTVIVNDPYGDKNQGYMNYNGAGVSYDWPGYNNGYSNLNTVHCFIYAEYPDSPENIGLTQGIWVYENDPSSYPVEYGQWLDAQFTVKNYGSQAVTFSKIGIGGRAPSSNGGNPDPNNVYDLGFDNNITLQPNEQRTFFYEKDSFGKNNIWGTYKLTAVYQLPDGTWHDIPPGESGTGTSHEFQVVQHSSASSLSNGIGKNDYVPRKGYDHFYIDLPSNASNLVIKTTEARNGDYIDLYEKAGSIYPTTSSYDHAAYTSSSNETITISNPSSGRHCILVYGYYSSGSERGTPYKITATYENPPTLSYITISGSTQVNENSGAQYTCTAYYSDGSTSNVTSSSGWSENSSYASISSSGYLTTSSVSSDQSCTITATYGGKSDTHNVTIKNVPPTLSYITISGSTQVNENSGAQYTCTAYYSDGSTSNVTSSSGWSENSSYASISSSGYLTTSSVSSDQSCTITATYGGKSDTHNVTIKNVPPTLSYITISGSTQVNENSGAQYTCTAYYSDGSTSNVTSSSGWSENSSYASISSSGYLTTSSVSSDQSCTITATYGGKSDTYSVTIKNVSQDVGSIRVSIVPQEAADAGAQWRVLGEGIWRNSGTIKSNVPFGTYTIEFKDISGWNTPPNKEVTVFAAVPNPWINSDPYTQICTYSISHANKSFDSTGGSGSVSVTTQSGCSWTAVSNATWITITSGSSGSGNGTVYYSVFANTGSSSRTGTMTIAGKTFTVTQTEFVSCEFDISDPEIILLTVPTEVEIGKSYTGQVRLKDDLGLQTWDVQIYDGAMDECKFRIENEAVSGKDTIKSFTFEVGSDWVQGNGLIEIVAIDVCNKGSRVYHTDFNIKPATATKDELAIDFKTAGIYVYNTGIWSRIYQGVDPEGLCSFGTYLAVDFGTTYGLYVYDAGAWTRVYKGVAIEKMAGFGGKLAVDFGTSYPLYEYDFATDTWTPIYQYSSPRDTIEALGDKLVVDFKTAGIYVYDAGIWNKIYQGVDPVNIVSFGDKLAIDFGITYGLYVYEYDIDNWTKIYKGVAIEKMAEIDRDLAIDFGTAYGLYVYEFDTDNWTKVYKGVAIEKMAGFDGNLAVDFGTTYPIYEYDFDTNNWNSIYQYSSPRDELVPANIFD